MSTESDRGLKLAARKRQAKRLMCEEVIGEIEKGLFDLKSAEGEEKDSVVTGLVGSKSALLELKKDLVVLEDEYMVLVRDEELEGLCGA